MDTAHADYKIVYEPGFGEYEEKKSRFLAQIHPVETQEQATAILNAARKQYFDARHNCSASILGVRGELTKCSDDGEPSGTAGKPMLEVLQGAGVTYTMAVVTRYFGGTLLGTGGLVRAYTEAVKDALLHVKTATMRYGSELIIVSDYPDSGKIQYLLGNEGILPVDTTYTDKVSFLIKIPYHKTGYIQKQITEATGARAAVEVKGNAYYLDHG